MRISDWSSDVCSSDPDAQQEAFADVVVVIGGASRGDRDFGRSAFALLGLDIAFADVAIKPGKPVWYGRLGQTHVLGLPGNPTAAFTVASLFLAPLLAGLRSEEHTSELQSLMRSSYAVFCLTKKNN